MSTRGTRQPLPATQRGATLVVALVLLLVLTMLGLSALNTVTLEERMAANSQDQMRAFQAGETALATAFATTSGLNPDVTINAQTVELEMSTVDDAPTAGANYTVLPRGQTSPPRGSGAEVGMLAFHFESIATAFSATNGRDGGGNFLPTDNASVVVLHGGAYIVPGTSQPGRETE